MTTKATDFTVTLENRPGTLAVLGETLGKAGVNIEGLCGIPVEGKGVIHVLVDNPITARRVLADAGIQVTGQRDVLVLEVSDRPGEFGKVARRIADAGVNIDLVYLATNTRVVVGVDNVEKVQGVI